jgi:hypothetical protein
VRPAGADAACRRGAPDKQKTRLRVGRGAPSVWAKTLPVRGPQPKIFASTDEYRKRRASPYLKPAIGEPEGLTLRPGRSPPIGICATKTTPYCRISGLDRRALSSHSLSGGRNACPVWAAALIGDVAARVRVFDQRFTLALSALARRECRPRFADARTHVYTARSVNVAAGRDESAATRSVLEESAPDSGGRYPLDTDGDQLNSAPG